MNIKYLSSSYDLSDLDGMTRDEVDRITVEDGERDDALAELINDVYPSVEVVGYTFYPADVIQSCDPIMWRMMVADEFNDVDLDDYRDKDEDDDEGE